ncbi:MAG TPA: hypothetical protein VG602_03890 [Actinomycetota bacterium]|nr:hypothetical protein [Actinomycetota bacterium]
MVRRMTAFVSTLPVTVRIGAALILGGLVVDVAYHMVASHPTLAARCCGPGFVGHVLTLGGMLLALAGAVATGLHHRSRLRKPQERRS